MQAFFIHALIINVLKTLQDPRVVPLLSNLLRSRHTDVAAQAAEALSVSLASVPQQVRRSFQDKDLLKDKKGLLVNFWFCGCAPCREEFPHLRDLYGKLKAQGFEIAAINAYDDKDAIEKYAKEMRLEFPILMAVSNMGIPKDYGVNAFPTSFILDPGDKITFVTQSFAEQTRQALQDALSRLGFKP
jgi:thiol-disulfide isomerase/thioredoxin